MPTKQTQLPISGLQRNPNKFVTQPGSCAEANNVVIRQPGVMEPLPTDIELATVGEAPFNRQVMKLMYGNSNRVTVVSRDYAQPNRWVEEDSIFATGSVYLANADEVLETGDLTLSPEYTEILVGGVLTRPIGFAPGMTHQAYSHGRTMLTEKWNTLVLEDGVAPRVAGLLPPSFSSQSVNTSSVTQWLLEGNAVTYKFIYQHESPEQTYINVGPPSSDRFVENSLTDDYGVAFILALPDTETLPAVGDTYVVVYRTPQADVDLPNELIPDYRQVLKIKITSADIAAGNISFVDETLEDARDGGAPLYTNEGQEGAGQANYPPPCARDVAVFKDTTFYANKRAHSSLQLNVPAYFGFLVTDQQRERGIGNRAVTGSMPISSTQLTIPLAIDRLGLVPGQRVEYPVTGQSGIIVSGPVANVYTMSVAASAAITSQVFVAKDVIQLRAAFVNGSSTVRTETVEDMDLLGVLLVGGFRASHGPMDFTTFSDGFSFSIDYLGRAQTELTRFRIGVTNGQNYSPAYTGTYNAGLNIFNGPLLESKPDVHPNRIFIAKTGQPESVSPASYIDVGAGTILKMWPSLSALFVIATDGLWRVTGDGTDWAVDQIDPTVKLMHPDCVTSLNNIIYAWVKDGIVAIDENGATNVAIDALGPEIRLRADALTVDGLGTPYYVWGPAMAGDDYHNEVWLNLNTPYQYFEATTPQPQSYQIAYIYNDETKQWTTQNATSYQALVFADPANRMILNIPQFLSGVPQGSVLVVSVDSDVNAIQTVHEAQVLLNPIAAGDMGLLKQWIDVNWVIEFSPEGDPGTGIFQTIFTGGTTPTPPINERVVEEGTQTTHFFVPRRVATKSNLQFGFQTNSAESVSPVPFKLYGFTVRLRVASDTFDK